MSAPSDFTGPQRRLIGRPFPKGVSPNPGGKPKKLAALEKVLDEHRDPIRFRNTLERLRALAMGETVFVTGDDGEAIEARIVAHPGFMKLYLDRVLGPVKEDASEKIEALAKQLLDGMLEEARARRESGADSTASQERTSALTTDSGKSR